MRNFFIVSGVILILLFTILGVGYIYIKNLEINEHKAFIASKLKSSTGLEFKFKGDLYMDRGDTLTFSSGRIEIYDQLGLLVELDSLYFQTPFQLSFDSLLLLNTYLKKPIYHFRTALVVPFETNGSEGSSGTGSFYALAENIEVSNARFKLYDLNNDQLLDVYGADSKNAHFSFTQGENILKSFQINADIVVNGLDGFGFSEKGITSKFEMTNGELYFDSRIRKGKDKVNLNIDLNPEYLVYHFKGTVDDEDISELTISMNAPGDFIVGRFDAEYDIRFSIPDSSLNIKDVSGRFYITSNDAVLRGVKLDKLIRTYRRTQNFSMKDLGSVMLLGPWGLAVSKGSDYAELAMMNSKDSSLIKSVCCELELDSGRLDFKDVAFKTQKNRIALSGGLDLVNKEYKKFSYALLKKDNCAEIREEFNGSFGKNEVKTADRIGFLLGPVTNLFQGTSDIILDKDCQWKYDGSVEADVKTGLFARKK